MVRFIVASLQRAAITTARYMHTNTMGTGKTPAVAPFGTWKSPIDVDTIFKKVMNGAIGTSQAR